MFYSQTFLARKGPLGTVWCAAHLQHRLKKSHYTSTDISSTVDRIMFPEVPIALRMSGHLLLGVVRIYSKKVDYLFQDCNVVLVGLRKVFASIDLNLPEDARQAPVQSITLPETFDLDALELNDDTHLDETQDNHLRNQEDITLTDQIPAGRDPFVVISFDDDIMMDFSRPEEVPDSGVRPMDEDILPSPVDRDADFQSPGPSNQTEIVNSNMNFQDPGPSNQTEVLAAGEGLQDPGPSNQTELLNASMDFQDPGSSNQTELLNMRLSDDTSPQNLPEIEVMRDAVHDFSSANLPPVCPDGGNEATEPNRSSEQILNEKEIRSPILEDLLTSGEQFLPFQEHSEPPASASSKEAFGISDTRVSFGHSSLGLAIRSSPPVQQPKPRPRKRKHFDESTVLSNRFMKKALKDSSDLVQKRRKVSCSALGLWKFTNSVIKEQVFDEPLRTGLSEDLCNLFKKDYISTKPHLLVLEEATPEPRVAQSPPPATEATPEPGVAQSPAPATEANPEPRVAESSVPVPEIDMEIERLRHHEGNPGNQSLPDFMPSPFRRDDFTPVSTKSLGSELVPQAGTTIGTSVFPSPDVAASTGIYGSELETPRTLLEERLGVDNTGLSNIPEFTNSAEPEDLYFLEADNNTPTGTQGSQGVESLSVRTRAVAQYLKRQSPITPVSEDPSVDLSLNKILEGKTRKLCARMFFETLALKSYGLVDVQQQQPYSDIILKLTPTLSKAQI